MSIHFSSVTPNPNAPGVNDVSPQDVHEKMDQIAIIDVRRDDEFSGDLGHIQGAQLLTLDQLPSKIDDLPKDKTIIFICRSGNRSGQAAAFALESGFKNVYNMKGGMLLWNELGLKIEK